MHLLLLFRPSAGAGPAAGEPQRTLLGVGA